MNIRVKKNKRNERRISERIVKDCNETRGVGKSSYANVKASVKRKEEKK